MLFDIRTPNTAYCFLQEFLGITSQDFIQEYFIECNKDFDEFWDRWVDRIRDINIDDLEYIALHVTSNSDNCFEVKKNGIKNLQSVLSDDTALKALLFAHDIRFDIERKLLHIGQRTIDIDYDKYRGRFDLSPIEKKIGQIARKVYFDYQVNAFFQTLMLALMEQGFINGQNFYIILLNYPHNLIQLKMSGLRKAKDIL